MPWPTEPASTAASVLVISRPSHPASPRRRPPSDGPERLFRRRLRCTKQSRVRGCGQDDYIRDRTSLRARPRSSRSVHRMLALFSTPDVTILRRRKCLWPISDRRFRRRVPDPLQFLRAIGVRHGGPVLDARDGEAGPAYVIITTPGPPGRSSTRVVGPAPLPRRRVRGSHRWCWEPDRRDRWTGCRRPAAVATVLGPARSTITATGPDTSG